MASSPLLERRFGRGAARLLIGVPVGAAPIASFAQANAPGEKLGALIPSLLCAMLVLGIVALTELRLDSPADVKLAEVPTVIELDAFELEAPEIETLVEPQSITTEVIAAAPASETERPSPIEATQPNPSKKRFDLSQLALRSAPAIPSAALEAARPESTTSVAARRPGGNPTPGALTDLALAVPANAEQAFSGARALQTEERVFANPGALRPRAAGSAPGPNADAEWTGAEERTAFLAALAQEQANQRGVGASHNEPPPVALTRASSAAQVAVRAQLNTELRQQGWHEVPLDALPDCSPPGRQDALKRRILVAAESTPTCQNTAGSYRFLETRNLNAFLMWSRTNPDGQQTAGSPRDVCEVLSRALDCLTHSSMEEIGTR